MRRSGTVASINPSRAMVAIASADDAYTIIEVLTEWDLDVGDQIVWESGYGLGGEMYRDEIKQTSEEVYVQDHSVSPDLLRKALLLD